MLKIAYAITSRNYLAQTKVAVESFHRHHRDHAIYIFNIDTPIYDIDLWSDNTAIHHYFLHNLDVEHRPLLRAKYNDFEFCNAIKPFIGLWLFEKFKDTTSIVYIDSDLVFFSKIELENELLLHTVVITPHALTAYPIDHCLTSELDILNSGIYNAGFFVITHTQGGINFLEWWKERTLNYCYVDFEKGMFVDQIWLNLAPVYFNDVLILKNPGYNVAHWNLHERTLSLNDHDWYVNTDFKLVFFHFSGFAIDEIAKISKHQNRFSLESRPDLTPIFKEYKEDVEKSAQEFNALLGVTSSHQRLIKKTQLKIQKWKGKFNKIIKILTH